MRSNAKAPATSQRQILSQWRHGLNRETAGVERKLGLSQIMRRYMVADEKRRVERDTVQVADAADEPEELVALQFIGTT